MKTRFRTVCRAMLAALALAGTAIAAQAATGAGAADPLFGTSGSVKLDLAAASFDDDVGGGIVQPDGKAVVSGVRPRTGDTTSIFVARFLDNGALDPGFGSGGVATFALDESAYGDFYGPALDAAGRILVVGAARSGGVYQCVILAVRSDGSLDPAFGSAGVVRWQFTAGKGSECIDIKVQTDGRIVALGREGTTAPHFLLRLNANGTPDVTFGNGGMAAMPVVAGQYQYALALTAAGGMVTSGGNGTNGVIYRFRPDGALDTAFAAGGRYATSFTSAFLHRIATLGDGSVLAAGYRGSTQIVIKLDPAGAPVTGFGSAGVANINAGNGYTATDLAVQPDGRILVAIRRSEFNGDQWRYVVARLNANGTFDGTFGSAGIATMNYGNLSEVLYAGALGPDGKYWLFGRGDLSEANSAILVGRILGDEITTPVVEFFNAGLNHYFVTANPAEAAAIDGGAAGPGWTRTGLTFKSGGPNKACRFYGNPDTNPATGARRGPNSHFYTLESAECAQVKKDAGWRFESYDYNAWPLAAGACPAGTTAVKRVYNGRFAQNDSNHRYTTSDAAYAQMLAQGWSGEGTVFCAPN